MTATTPTPRDPRQLRGKVILFFRLNKTHGGFRRGKVKKVTTGRGGQWKTLVVESGGGQRFRVTPAELLPNHPTGLVWRGRVVPVQDWLEGLVR